MVNKEANNDRRSIFVGLAIMALPTILIIVFIILTGGRFIQIFKYPYISILLLFFQLAGGFVTGYLSQKNSPAVNGFKLGLLFSMLIILLASLLITSVMPRISISLIPQIFISYLILTLPSALILTSMTTITAVVGSKFRKFKKK